MGLWRKKSCGTKDLKYSDRATKKQETELLACFHYNMKEAYLFLILVFVFSPFFKNKIRRRRNKSLSKGGRAVGRSCSCNNCHIGALLAKRMWSLIHLAGSRDFLFPFFLSFLPSPSSRRLRPFYITAASNKNLSSSSSSK